MSLKIEEPNWFCAELKQDGGESLRFPVSKVVCVGRNYIAHAQELNNPIPDEPLFFIKPNSSLSDFNSDIVISQLPYGCHYEAELALLIGRNTDSSFVGRDCVDNNKYNDCVVGVGLALDLTYRDVQAELKNKGHPWEKSKAFAGSCPITAFTSINDIADLTQLSFYLKINGQTVQHGCTQDMIFSIERLVSEAASCFSLTSGDIILTGTPSGVGLLSPGDKLEIGYKSAGIDKFRCSSQTS